MRRAAVVLGVSAAIQIALCALPDTMGDLLQYRHWCRTLAADGLAAAYWPPDTARSPVYGPVDYPPLVPYALWGLGRGLAATAPALLASDRWLDFWIRLPGCAALLLLAGLVGSETRRFAPGRADLAIAAVALNPALVFDTAYWGQTDSLCALAIAAAMVALVRGRPELAWAALTVAAGIKPFALPFGPIVLVETVRRFGARRAATGALASAAVAAAIVAPFAVEGRLGDILHAVFAQAEAMPYASVNAHNLWWLLCRGLPWTEASARVAGLVTLRGLGLLLFAALGAATLWRLARSADSRAAYVAATSVGFGFFVLSTHMHENHLFYGVALMAFVAATTRRAGILFVGASLTLLLNMALHDPLATQLARPLVPGPQLVLPRHGEPDPAIASSLAAAGYPWLAGEIRGEVSLVGLLATMVNAQANLVLLAAWLGLALAAAGHAPPPFVEGPTWPRSRASLLALLGVVFLAGLPFAAKAFAEAGLPWGLS
ncbi:MAG: glycosyltransferase 87 family protein [Vicinamibacteria bacterium]